MLSFGVSFVSLYLTLIYPMFCPNNGFQMFHKTFSKTKMFSKRFPKDCDSVISYVACTIFLS